MIKTKTFIFEGLIFFLAISFMLMAQIKYGTFNEGKRDLIAPPQGIEHFAFGFHEPLSDLFWIRSIQDFDYCGEKLAVNLCKGNGWLYRMLDTITNLSPHFKMVYLTGGLALTVLVSDYEGASKFFDKSVKQYPTDWRILYRASYHYMIEEKNKEKAAYHLREAGRFGAPKWVFNLAGRLYSDSGEQDLANSILQEMIESNMDEQLIQRLRDKIKDQNR